MELVKFRAKMMYMQSKLIEGKYKYLKSLDEHRIGIHRINPKTLEIKIMNNAWISIDNLNNLLK